MGNTERMAKEAEGTAAEYLDGDQGMYARKYYVIYTLM